MHSGAFRSSEIMPPQSILVTGGAGFIGGHFLRMTLAEDSLEVVNLDKLTYAGHQATIEDCLQHPRHKFVQGDVCDGSLLAEVFQKFNPVAIVHFAAESHVDRSIDGPAAFVQTNVVGTLSLLEAARMHWSGLNTSEQKVFRFLHVSTDEVYGSAEKGQAFQEGDVYCPTSPYAASKASADHLVSAFGKTYGLPVLTTHCTNNYGPYQFPEKLIPLMIHNAVVGQPLPVYGNGQQVRDWLYVEDHCRALQTVLQSGEPGSTYHIAGDSLRTNLEIVEMICDIVDELVPSGSPRRSLIQFVEDRPAHDNRYALDASKLQGELNWYPEISVEQGLLKTVQWYLENRTWAATVTDGRYGFERLGLAGQTVEAYE